jgi:hypothetical protein
MIAKRVISVIWVFIVLIVSLAAISGQDITIPPQGATKPPEKLESVLYQLINAQNRADFAEAHGLYLTDDRVRVIIELNDTEVSEIENVLTGYGAVIETYYKNLVQALVPADKLIALSEEPGVRYIRTPRTPVPLPTQTPTETPTPLISPWPPLGIILAIIAAIIVINLTKRRRRS